MDHPTSTTFTFEPNSERFVRDPYPDYAWLRDNAPVYYWAERDALLVSRLEDIRGLFSDERLSTDIRKWAHYPGDDLFRQPRFAAWARVNTGSLFLLPPADHARVRKLAAVALTPRAVRRMDGAIKATVSTVLDQVVASADADGTINVRDYAEAIPLTVICDMLGIPAADRAEFRSFGISVIRSVQPTNDMDFMNEIADAFTGGVALLERVIRDRRAMSERPDDLLTDWIEANEDGERLNDDELISLAAALISAGSDTTVHGTCFAIHALLKHPEALRELQADSERSLLRGAIEETLRWNNFGKGGIMRYALQDFEWGGVEVRKGQLVTALLGAAGYDAAVYAEPERFDIHRGHRPNLTFGLGRHFCLGANLARSELMLAVETLLLERYPDAELVGEPVFELDNDLMRPMTALRVRLGDAAVGA